MFSLTSKVKPTELTKNGNIKEINASLEELLKSLNDGDQVYQLNKEDENKNENENHTISQITKKLENDMVDFNSYYNTKYTDEENIIKKQKERDIIMKAEGRNEILKKQLSQFTFPEEYSRKEYSRSFLDENIYNRHNLSYENNFIGNGGSYEERQFFSNNNRNQEQSGFHNNNNHNYYYSDRNNRNSDSMENQNYNEYEYRTNNFNNRDDNFHGYSEQKDDRRMKKHAKLADEGVREQLKEELEKNTFSDEDLNKKNKSSEITGENNDQLKTVKEMIDDLENLKVTEIAASTIRVSVSVSEDLDEHNSTSVKKKEEKIILKEIQNEVVVGEEASIDRNIKNTNNDDNNNHKCNDNVQKSLDTSTNIDVDIDSQSVMKGTESDLEQTIKHFQQGLGNRIKELDILHASVLGIADSKILDPSSGPRSLVTFQSDNNNTSNNNYDNNNNNNNNNAVSSSHNRGFNIRNIEELSSSRPRTFSDEDKKRDPRPPSLSSAVPTTVSQFYQNSNAYGRNRNENGDRYGNGNGGQMGFHRGQGQGWNPVRGIPHSIYSNNNFDNNDNNNDNDNNNNSNRANNNATNQNNIQSHPYAGSAYSPSPCIELVHSNLLTVSKGNVLISSIHLYLISFAFPYSYFHRLSLCLYIQFAINTCKFFYYDRIFILIFIFIFIFFVVHNKSYDAFMLMLSC